MRPVFYPGRRFLAGTRGPTSGRLDWNGVLLADVCGGVLFLVCGGLGEHHLRCSLLLSGAVLDHLLSDVCSCEALFVRMGGGGARLCCPLVLLC